MCGSNCTFLPKIHPVFTICDISSFIILIQLQKNISPFSLPDHLSLHIVTSKCWFLSLRVTLERHGVRSLFLGWAVFSSLETFLVLFLFWGFPHRVPYPIYLSLNFCRAVTPFPIPRWVMCTSCCLCLHFGLMSCFVLNITVLSALLFQLSQLLLPDVFQFFYGFHHGVTAFFCFVFRFWSVSVSNVFCHFFLSQ